MLTGRSSSYSSSCCCCCLLFLVRLSPLVHPVLQVSRLHPLRAVHAVVPVQADDRGRQPVRAVRQHPRGEVRADPAREAVLGEPPRAHHRHDTGRPDTATDHAAGGRRRQEDGRTEDEQADGTATPASTAAASASAATTSSITSSRSSCCSNRGSGSRRTRAIDRPRPFTHDRFLAARPDTAASLAGRPPAAVERQSDGRRDGHRRRRR